MDLPKPFATVQTLESYRGEIFRLYIVLNRTATEVIAALKRDHNFEISPKVFKTKLSQWGYTKNVKRCEVVQILREKARWQSVSLGKYYAFTLRQRPIHLERVERHRKRAGILDQQQYLLDQAQNVTTNVLCQRCPPLVPILELQHWGLSEKLLYDIDILIKGSFEAGLWSFTGNELLIRSSTSQDLEIAALHDFLGDFAIGCHAADALNFAQAGACWRRAFINIEVLVKGQYHDIIPNLVQKINDLNRQGYTRLAAFLKEHIARCGKRFLEPNSSTMSIFDGLGKLDMAFMLEIEGMIMNHFTKLFELYLGHQCYSSFVIMMDRARRRLLQYPWATFDCLPDISYLDSIFGPTDRRSLDVIGTRVEILNHRGVHIETEIEAATLVQRAEMIQGDNWQRFYNLVRGWYFLGAAQYFLRKRDVAILSLSNALRSDDELCKIDEFHIFDAERKIISKYLEHLQSFNWIMDEKEGFDKDLNCSIGPLVFFRCCKEPRRPIPTTQASQG